MIGHPLSSLPVDDVGVDVRAVSLTDAFLLVLDVLLPRGEQVVERFILGRGDRVANCRSKSAGFVDQSSEHIEDDDIDLANLGHAFSCSCLVVTSTAGDNLATNLLTPRRCWTSVSSDGGLFSKPAPA